jgi:pimeloyl-ACP methyl ester carboxylesterase
MTTNLLARGAIAATMLVGTAACTEDARPPTPDPAPAFTEAPCPPDVEGVVLDEVTCGDVTVPLRHGAKDDGDTSDVQVFVTKISPRDGTGEAEPVLVAGTSLATTPNYLGIAPLAQRTGREVIIVDPRGSGHSRPSIDCPGVHAAAEEELTTPAASSTTKDAVAACHEELLRAGIDPGEFGVAAMAEDLEVVREALGVDKWAVASYGSASLLVAELVGRHPDPVTAVVLDSPLLPGMDLLAFAEPRLGRVVGMLVRACAIDPSCERRYGASDLSLEGALRAVGSDPIALRVGAERISLDQDLVLRAMRQMTSDGGSSGATFTLDAVPSVLRQIIDRDIARLNRGLGEALRAQEAFCLGRSSNCLRPRHHISVGAWLTITCGDLLRSSEASSSPTSAALSGVGLCDEWPVDAVAPAARVDWAKPTLIAAGRYATYSPPSTVRDAVRELDHVTWIVAPTAGHNVLPASVCTLGLREAWLRDPAAQLDRTCLASERFDWLTG